MSYPQTKLGKLVKIKGGKRLPKGEDVSRTATVHPYIRAQDISNGRIACDDLVYISDEVYKKIKNYTVKAGDVCITIVGAYVGDVGIVPVFLNGANLTENAVKLIDPVDKCDLVFIMYNLLSGQTQTQMKLFAGGAAQAKLGIYKISEIDVFCPPISTQKKVAKILSAYDDLIENNSHRIQILEEMARMIYQEWFVKFRFPGYEQAKFVESPMGMIPEGWEVKQVKDVIVFNPKISVKAELEKPYVAMEGLSTNSMIVSLTEYRTNTSGSKFQNGDTLFARITPCLENGKTGFVNFLPENQPVSIGSTEFIVLRSKTLCPEYVYLLARSDSFRDVAIKSMSGASGRQRVNVDCFNDFLIVQPDDKTLSYFQKIATPIFEQVKILSNKNKVLRSTRDLLLPKLISGELDVSDLDITIER